MDITLSTIKENYQEILKRKVEERSAEMSLGMIGEYENLKDRYEKMRSYMDRLEAGESPESVVKEYYGESKERGLLEGSTQAGIYPRY